MKFQRPKYEFPVEGIRRTAGVGQPAGLFLLDGDLHVVARWSAAEADLLERGAIHFANLRFDHEAVGESRAWPPVRPLGAASAARRFARLADRN
jgi:hypothetical protein